MQETASDQAGEKIPPQNIEAEKSLLGAILLSDDSFSTVLELVKASDFYDPRHSKIFASMTRLFDARRKIDLITLSTDLGNQKLLKEVGGRAYISDLETFVPISSHAEDYAKIVAEASLRRRLIKAGTKIATAAYDGGAEIGELLGEAEQNIFEVSDETIKNDYVAIGDLLVDAYDRIEELHKNKGALRGLRTGFRDIDKKTAGLQKGDLIIIGARPAMGKTTFAENLSYNVATRNGEGKGGVLFFSMEMPKEELIERMVSSESGVDNWRIRTGNLSDEDFTKIGDAMAEMNEAPLYIDDTGEMTVLEIRNKARRAKHDHGISMVVVDYLQLIRGTDRYKGNRVQEVTEISRGLKQLARELEIPVVALAQLNRGVTDRDDPRPVLSDLRESGSIEQDADLVMMLHRVDYYHNEDDYEPTNITELIIAKHRHGEVGKIKLYFHPQLLKFLSLDTEHADPQ